MQFGPWLAAWALSLVMTGFLYVTASIDINHQYRNGFMNREEKADKEKKLKVFFLVITFCLPHILPR